MEKENFESLLNTSRNKIQLGDTFASVHTFLKNKGADEETVRKIITILDQEDRERKKINRPQERQTAKISGVAQGIFTLAGGVILLVAGWYFLKGGLEVDRIFILPLIATGAGAIIALIGLIKTGIAILKK
ncbi:hypothetical protein GCM10009122_13250 [Fulvivirga kasyanovii]|uniref:DUF2335 domain-containing protein n=1 Tax=Fulvivirga kasyanovii TaxID=396812 RepID=A0ABW9RYG1_9BACT|nr:hypothetical protein [Fulvivirga kasyanovii]MTI28248.1 hypothetical protein [Fulvivirga kasyanovii]